MSLTVFRVDMDISAREKVCTCYEFIIFIHHLEQLGTRDLALKCAFNISLSPNNVESLSCLTLAGRCAPSEYNCVSIGGRFSTAHDESVSWYDARDTCRSSGTDLAVFGDQNEINDVMSKLSSLNLDGHYTA